MILSEKAFSQPLQQNLVVGDSDNPSNDFQIDFNEIEKKKRKKQGGKGHGALSKIAKIKIILSQLKHIRLCSSEVNFHHGHYMAEITRFFTSIDHRGTSKIIQELIDTGNIIAVCHTKHRGRIYGEKIFYYLTDKGERTYQSYAASGLD